MATGTERDMDPCTVCDIECPEWISDSYAWCKSCGSLFFSGDGSDEDLKVMQVPEMYLENLWEIVSYGGSYDKESDTYNSCALSGVSYAMEALVRAGQADLVKKHGRIVEIKPIRT